MERIKLIFFIFLLLILVSFALGYGVDQIAPFGEIVTGTSVILSSLFTLFLLFYEMLKGN